MPAITFSGLASGIDADAVIKAITDAQRLQQIPIQNRVDDNTKENTALTDLSSKLLGLSDTLKGFMTLQGGAVLKVASSSNASAVTATAGSNAISSSTAITVKSLATNGTVSFPDRIGDLDQPLFAGLAGPATITVTVGSGSTAETKEVTVDGKTTATGLMAKLNELVPGKLRASAVNVGSGNPPDYRLVISTLKSGAADGALSIGVPPEIAALGKLQNPIVTSAQDAVIEVEGVGEIRRGSNQVSDLIPGVSLDLKQAGTGPIVIQVSNDSDATAKRMGDVIASMNELIKYVNENDRIQRVDDEKRGPQNVYGSLARSNVDEQVLDALKRALADANSGVDGSSVRIFADLGVTTQRDGTLAFDTTKFMESVSKDPQAAERLLNSFADRVSGATGVVHQFTRFQGTIDLAKTANDRENEQANDRLSRMEKFIEKQTETLRLTFANLEKRTAELQQGASSLISLLPSGK